MFGSRRLASAHTILMDGAPVRASASASSPPVSASASAPAIDSTEAPAAAVEVSEEAPVVAERKGPLQFGGIIATEAQKQQIEDIRSEIAKIPGEERSKMTKWVDELLDEDILRYVIQFKKDAFNRIKATAVFRKEEGIDNILETDAEKFESYFEPGKEEIVYLAPDKLGRPILLYRSAFHWPGVQDPKEYTRYILYQTEKTRIRNGLGVDRQSCVIVERIGSGHKNQDPALLKVLLPTVLNHYPMYIGDVYIAPISTVFFIVWKLIQLILDEATKKRLLSFICLMLIIPHPSLHIPHSPSLTPHTTFLMLHSSHIPDPSTQDSTPLNSKLSCNVLHYSHRADSTPNTLYIPDSSQTK